MVLRVATPVSPLPNPYWVREWENNPQNNRSLSFISQETKDKIRQIANYLPNIDESWPKENKYCSKIFEILVKVFVTS